MNKKTNKYLAANVILPEQPQAGALLLGDCNSAVDLAILKPHKVRTIVSIGLEAQPAKDKILEEISHHVYDIHDNKQQKLPVQLLDQVCSVIEKGRQRGGVLVHCYAGVSRSSSFVIAYLINKYLLSYDQAKQKAKKKRPCVHPGDGFVRQLQYYSKVIVSREQERLANLQKAKTKEETFPATVTKKNESFLMEKARRGVRGAVKSAELMPQQIKCSFLNKSLIGTEKEVEETQQQKIEGEINPFKEKMQLKIEENPDRLPLISERYKPCSSQVQIRDNIDRIQGKQLTKKGLSTQKMGGSVQKIYRNKPKVL